MTDTLLQWCLEWFNLDELNPEFQWVAECAFVCGVWTGVIAGLIASAVITIGLPFILDLIYP